MPGTWMFTSAQIVGPNRRVISLMSGSGKKACRAPGRRQLRQRRLVVQRRSLETHADFPACDPECYDDDVDCFLFRQKFPAKVHYRF